MGKAKKPKDVLHKCRYAVEVIEKLKANDWEEREGYLVNKDHVALFLHDKDAALETLPFLLEYETAEFFTLLKAPYKEWRHVKNIPYNTKYGLHPSWIIQIIRILYGGFSAKIIGKVVLGFLPTTKPIIMHIPYKDDYAVFIIAPLLTEEGLDETEIYGEKWELEYWLGDKTTYYDLERQVMGFCVEGKIVSIDEYRELVKEKIREKEVVPVGITVYSIARPISEVISELRDYGIIKEIEVPEEKLPKEYGVLLERRPPNEVLTNLELFVLEPVTADEVISVFKIDEASFKFLEEDIKRKGIDAVKKDFVEDILREVPKEIKWKRIPKEDAERVAEKIIEKIPEKVDKAKTEIEERIKEEKAPEPVPAEKEPWMMTKEEWVREHIKNVDKLDKWIKQAEFGETVDISTTEIDESFPVGKVLIYGNIASTFPSTFDETSKTIYINIDKPSDYVSEILNIKDKTIQVYYALLHEVEHLRWSLEGKPLNPYSPETQYEKYYSHPSEVAAREASTAFLKPLLDAHRKAVRQALSEGKQVPKEVVVDYPDLIPEEEIPEEKWENVTKIKEELEYEEISLTESGEEYLKEAVETFYDTGRTDLVREIMSHVTSGDKIADIIIPVFLKEEIEEKIKPLEVPPSPDDLELIPEVKIEIEKGQKRLL